jgi:hypothetical protein
MDEHGWKEKTSILDGWLANDAKIWKVVHHEELWIPKVQCLMFFSTFGCCFVCFQVSMFDVCYSMKQCW